MDRIEKTLFILPFLPLADMVSTHFSLSFGGEEVGILGGPIYERYGESGLVALSSIVFFVFLACIWAVRFAKRKFIQEQVPKLHRVILVIGVNAFLMAEAYLIGGIIQNFLVPFLSPLVLYAIWSIALFAYFISASFFTRREMKQLIRD